MIHEPHERIVLGSMMLDRTTVDDATATLTGRDFADARHEAIFNAIVKLATNGKPTDALAVGDALRGDAIRVDPTYLHECIQTVAVAQSCGYYADQVKAASMLRAVTATGQRLIQLGETADADPLEVINTARAQLDELVTADADESHESAVYEAIASMERPRGIKTPWRDLNALISGWGPGMLHVVGARPGVGKTVFGIGVTLDVARRGQTAVMISLEMPKDELYLRMLSNVGTVDGQRIQHRSLRGDDDANMAKAAAHVSTIPIVIDDRSALSLAQIRAKVRGIQRTREVGIVVVDYLGLVKPPPDAPRNDRRVQVDFIAQGLKDLSRDLKVPVIALAQLNRGIEGRAVKQPTMADLRESGGIEAAADIVILLHRDDTDPMALEANIAKNRHGPQSKFTLTFRGEFSRIEDRASGWGQVAS